MSEVTHMCHIGKLSEINLPMETLCPPNTILLMIYMPSQLHPSLVTFKLSHYASICALHKSQYRSLISDSRNVSVHYITITNYWLVCTFCSKQMAAVTNIQTGLSTSPMVMLKVLSDQIPVSIHFLQLVLSEFLQI
jgi:hypothetical protein